MLKKWIQQRLQKAKKISAAKNEKELEKLEDAIAFKNVSNMPARVKCALLAWHTLEDMLNKNQTKGNVNINCCH